MKKKDIVIAHGPLMGMSLKFVKTVTRTGDKLTELYQSPDGPKSTIRYMKNKNELIEAGNREHAARIAFSRLVPANILWTKETGYRDRASGKKLQWDADRGKFVLLAEKVEEKEPE